MQYIVLICISSLFNWNLTKFIQCPDKVLGQNIIFNLNCFKIICSMFPVSNLNNLKYSISTCFNSLEKFYLISSMKDKCAAIIKLHHTGKINPAIV